VVAFGAVCALSVAGHALADEVLLKNGDRISGKIQSKTDDALVVAPDFASSTTLSIPLEQISTFSTVEPLVLKLKDGAVLNQVAKPAEAGHVVLAQPDAPRSDSPQSDVAQSEAPQSDAPLADAPEQQLSIAEIAKINPQPPRWRGSIGANGLYSRSSNTASQIGFNADAERRTDTDRINLLASYSYGRQTVDGATSVSADNWRVLGKYDDFLSPTLYAFGSLMAESDKVNVLRLRVTPSVGAGYQWIDRDDLHFRTEGGGSWLYEDYETQPQVLRKTALRLAYSADKTIDDGRIRLVHSFEYLPSTGNWDDFLVNADAGMRVALMGSLYSEVKAKLAYDSEPGTAARRTATELRIGMGLTY